MEMFVHLWPFLGAVQRYLFIGSLFTSLPLQTYPKTAVMANFGIFGNFWPFLAFFCQFLIIFGAWQGVAQTYSFISSLDTYLSFKTYPKQNLLLILVVVGDFLTILGHFGQLLPFFGHLGGLKGGGLEIFVQS